MPFIQYIIGLSGNGVQYGFATLQRIDGRVEVQFAEIVVGSGCKIEYGFIGFFHIEGV